MMTRKDFELIATVIRDLPGRSPRLTIATRVDIAEAFADELERDNSRFDYDRFLDDCGVPLTRKA